MKRLQAFKFQLRPNGQQECDMRRFAGACRFVFNKSLAWQNENHEAGNKYLPYVKMAAWLVEWKTTPETQWLKEAPSQPLQQALKDLERAYKNFFQKRASFPRFKKRGQSDAFRYPQGVKLDQENNRISLPKLGWISYRNSRQVVGEVKNVTVSQSCGKWYVSIQTEYEVAEPVHTSTSLVGLDAGVAKLATLSDGTIFDPVNSFKTHQKKLAKLQREMSRKVKFSNNWKKAKRKVQNLHSRIGNIRRDYLHKVSTTISKNHAMIFIEDLKVANMSKSAAGTVKQPGRNVRAKSGLNRSILDQGWYELRRQLEYKQRWRGGQVLAINPAYTSQKCACCGHTTKENRRSQSQFECLECGYTENADINGARNILAAGHAALACGEMAALGHSMKQDPPRGELDFGLNAVGILALKGEEDVKDTILREPTTVGEMLSEEFLKPLNITQAKLGEALNLSRPRIAEIISGKRRISIEEAVMLAALFETDSDFWINVQASHDRWEARQLMAQKTSVKPLTALLAR